MYHVLVTNNRILCISDLFKLQIDKNKICHSPVEPSLFFGSFFYLIFARFLTFIQSIMIEFLIFISILAFLNSMMVFGSIAVNCYLPCIRVSTPLEDLLLPFTN